jgi:hypothetical protein
MAEANKSNSHSPGAGPGQAGLGESSEQALGEMRYAMGTIFAATTNLMQAFIDVQLVGLKYMRDGVEDPSSAIDTMSRRIKAVVEASRSLPRKE